MDYLEFKALCIEKFKEKYRRENFSTDFLKRFKSEIDKAESYFLEGVDLYEEFKTKKASERYVLPYILDFNASYDLDGELQLIQITKGASGGVDIDSDFESSGRDKILAYLREKYGEDNVFQVGTLSALGLKSAVKDLLKYYAVPFNLSNDFTAILDNDLTFEENIAKLKISNPEMYRFYEKNQKILDLTPKFINKVRQAGSHAGGVIITPKPIYNYIPVERAGKGLVTAYPENGQNTALDELGLIKLDLLSITVLDNIKVAIDLIDEELFLIEEDGIEKIVPYSYLLENKDKIVS